jgi:quercetin dioxygenase-like cupin family protein
MPLLALVLASAVNWADAPPVPGRCAAPAIENVDKAGCFLAAQIQIDAAPAQLWWHVYEFQSAELADAVVAAEWAGKRWAVTTKSHGRIWVHLLGEAEEHVSGGARRAVIGPLSVPKGQPVTARFMESIFTPGMRTRVHSHSGPEAFYVLEGEQCMETPGERRKLGPGETFIVPPGPHVQAAPNGRKNILLVLHPRDEPWMKLEPYWKPSQFCAG